MYTPVAPSFKTLTGDILMGLREAINEPASGTTTNAARQLKHTPRAGDDTYVVSRVAGSTAATLKVSKDNATFTASVAVGGVVGVEQNVYLRAECVPVDGVTNPVVTFIVYVERTGGEAEWGSL